MGDPTTAAPEPTITVTDDLVLTVTRWRYPAYDASTVGATTTRRSMEFETRAVLEALLRAGYGIAPPDARTPEEIAEAWADCCNGATLEDNDDD